MLAHLTKVYSILTPRSRRRGAGLLVLMVLAALLEVLGVAMVPAFVSALIDPARLTQAPVFGPRLGWVAETDPSVLVVWGAALLLLVFAIKNAFLIFNHAMQVRFLANRRVELSSRLLSAYFRAPHSFHLGRNRAELLRNVDQEANIVCAGVMTALLELGTKSLILVAVLAFLASIEPWITLAWTMFIGLVGLAGVKAMSGRLRRYGLEQQEQRKTFVTTLYEAFGSLKEARILGRDRWFKTRVETSVRRISNTARRKDLIIRSIPPLSEFVAIAGMLVLACGLVLLGRSTDSILVTLSLFVVGLVRIKEVSGAMMTHFAHLRHSLVSIDPLIADLRQLETGPAAHEPAARRTPLRLDREIALRGISYRFDGADQNALSDIDLVIPAGAAISLVGSTGAGKSTLVDVMMGLLRPATGGVFVDGIELRDLGVANWQATIGYVPQSIYLLDESIRRNIALGIEDAEIDEAALAQAIRLAQLDGLVARLAEGLDTRVGEQGCRLSGGERQRIGIARALYHDPQVIIFDEATSALDNTTERAVVDAVERLRGDRTVVMIAHRLSTVRRCDRLFFLKNGRIEAAGDFEELKGGHAEFRQMASA